MANDDYYNVDSMLDDALAGKSLEDPVTESDSKENVRSTDDKKSDRRRSRSRSRDRRKSRRSSSKDRKRKRSRSRDKKRSHSRDRKRSRSRDRERRRSRSRDRGDRRRRSRSRDNRRRSRSRDRPRVIDHRDRRSPRRSPVRTRLPGPERRDVMPFTARNSPPRGVNMEMSAEERDIRTIFITQIARQTRPRDLEEFFSSVGAVRDVRIITDSRTGRSKGIAYVEFWEVDSVALGLALNGQRLLGAPLVIQRTCAERNRAAVAASTVGSNIGFGPAPTKGPCKVQVSNLNPNIDENMLESIFAPFGRIESCKLSKDHQGRSTGVAMIEFRIAEDGAKAAEQLNNFDLAGDVIKVVVMDEQDTSSQQRTLDDAMGDRQGISLGQGGRLQLMAKLAQSGGVDMSSEPQPVVEQHNDPSIPAIATTCFLLSNMFDVTKETEHGWDEEVKQDVLEECSKNGGALHIYVDPTNPQGNVYVKCPSVSVAHKIVQSLHGRWFSGKVITANYVPVATYHGLFPDAAHSNILMIPRSQQMQHYMPPPGMYPPPPMGYMPPPPPQNGYGGYY